MSTKVTICGVDIDNVSLGEALDRIDELIRGKKNAYVITPNVDHIVKLRDDAEFRRIYSGASLVLADGMPLLWAANFLGTPLKEKISGSDLMPKVCERASHMGYGVFLLGGRPGAAEAAKKKLEATYPSIRIVGVHCPPLGFENDSVELEAITHAIKASAPDIVFVGLGAPKQEKWIAAYCEKLSIPVSIGVGVTFEFIAGVIRRAPKWMQNAGLEWFWRLLAEPGRLWRRYLIDDPRFFIQVFRQKRSQTKGC